MPTKPHPLLVEAHRGDSANAPENTLAAFRCAVDLGVPSIELDVQPAKSGTLMVMHDDTVDRTTNGSGAVCSLTERKLLGLDAGAKFAPQFAGEKIPRLADVLDLVTPTRTVLNIEIKASPPDLSVPGALVELLRKAGKASEHVVSSFGLEVLLEVRSLAPEITLALIGNGPDILSRARRHDIPWIHANHETVDAALVNAAHRHRLRVNVWTVDDPATLPHWRQIGVDKLCTNRPGDMLAMERDNHDAGA